MEYIWFPRLNELKIAYPTPKLLTTNAAGFECQDGNAVNPKQAFVIQVVHCVIHNLYVVLCLEGCNICLSASRWRNISTLKNASEKRQVQQLWKESSCAF